MNSKDIQAKINKVATTKSGWLEKAAQREKNEAWLNKSEEIGLRVLRYLRAKSMTQNQLAEQLNVSPQYISKIVKGKENLTLETISILENALGFQLISIPFYHIEMEISPSRLYIPKAEVKTPALKSNKEYETAGEFTSFQTGMNNSMAA